MPYRFTTGAIKKIANRLGLQKVRDKVWSGVVLHSTVKHPEKLTI